MPLSSEEFQAGHIDLAILVRQVLESRPDLSFNVEEVRELLAQTQARIASVEDVVMALDRLVTEGHAEVKELGGARWYTIAMETRRIEFRPGG